VIHHKWIAAGVVGAALLAGCSSSTSGSADQSGSDHHSGSPGSLSGALVAADDNTRARLEYGRPKAIVAASGGSSATGTYGGVSGYGFSDLANYAKLLPPLVGFDATTADEALTAGQPPTHAGWISGGVDATKVEQALTKLGAKKDGATLRLAGDAACLGDPLVAVLTDQPAGPSGPRRELGLAVTGTSSGDAIEVLCIATGSAADAAAMKTKLQDGLTSGTSQRSNEPWSQLLTGVSVEIRDGNVVRATAHPVAGQPAGTLLQALRNKDLASLIG
jgi:hypothetical protein